MTESSLSRVAFAKAGLPMFRLAVRTIFFESFKSLLIVLAIGAVIATILLLRGFENGFYEQARRFVMNRQAPVVVSQDGVLNLLGDRSSLPQTSRQAVEDIPGVEGAYPVTALPVIYKQGPQQNPVILWVYDRKGGPTHVIQGRTIEDSREVVIDWSLAKKFGLKPGDGFIVSDFEFRIAGITENSSTMSSPVVFLTYDGLIDMFLESDVVADVSVFPFLSHLLVELQEGADTERVMADIERAVPETNARPLEQVAQADVSLSRGIYGPPVGFLIAISYLAGILVIGLICFADVTGRLKFFAVLKALGFRNAQLIRTVASQTLLLLIAAFPLGIAFASLGAWAFETWRPQFLIVVLEPSAVIKTVSAALLLAIVGSLLPVRSIVRADPATAFQGN